MLKDLKICIMHKTTYKWQLAAGCTTGSLRAQWHCSLGRREFNVENTSGNQPYTLQSQKRHAGLQTSQACHPMIILPPPRKQPPPTPRTALGRCEKLFQSLVHIMICRYSLRANPRLGKPAGCSWALSTCSMTAGSEWHSPPKKLGYTRPPVAQPGEGEPRAAAKP